MVSSNHTNHTKLQTASLSNVSNYHISVPERQRSRLERGVLLVGLLRARGRLVIANVRVQRRHLQRNEHNNTSLALHEQCTSTMRVHGMKCMPRARYFCKGLSSRICARASPVRANCCCDARAYAAGVAQGLAALARTAVAVKLNVHAHALDHLET